MTIATSNGLVYSLGENLQALYKRSEPDDRLLSGSSHHHHYGHGSASSSMTTITMSDPSESKSESYVCRPTSIDCLCSDLIEIETQDSRLWEYINGNIDWDAVNGIAQPIITKFTFRTNGTCQSARFPGVGWSYFGADPEWGLKQATQLTVSTNINMRIS